MNARVIALIKEALKSDDVGDHFKLVEDKQHKMNIFDEVIWQKLKRLNCQIPK